MVAKAYQESKPYSKADATHNVAYAKLVRCERICITHVTV